MPEDVDLYRSADSFVSDNELFEENTPRVSRPSREVAEFAALRQRVQDIEVSEATPESSRVKKRARPRKPSATIRSKEEQLAILEQVLPHGQSDSEDLLTQIHQRMSRVGMRHPTVEIRFTELHVETEVFADLSRNLPSMLRAFRDPIETLFQRLWLLRPARRKLVILDSISGILKPGRLTLLLGAPSSGKTTLLKALAGQLQDSGLQVSGKVTYNGRKCAEFQPLRTASYVEQVDTRLIPEMTVRETMDFSARCQGSGFQKGLLAEVRKREAEAGLEVDPDVDAFMEAEALEGEASSIRTEFIIRMLALGICADTQVGNALKPACSPGQKKRVTTGEMLVGPQQVHFMDEISTGLDSSTTFAITKFLGDMTRLQQRTTLVALLQPAPETFDLFDDVLLISEGHIVYQGPTAEVKAFFAQLGFKCPERKGVADFLQEVTSAKDQQQYWASRHPYRMVTAVEMAERFKFEFHGGMAIAEELARPIPPETQKQNDAALVRDAYALSSWQMFRACLERELMLVSRNQVLYAVRFAQLLILAVNTGTLFIRTRMAPTSVADGNLYFGVVFFSLVELMFDGTIEMQLTQERLPGWYKQRDNRWLTAWAYVFCTTLLRLPFSLLDAAMWSVIVYFATGLAPEASRFFTFLLFLFLLHTLGMAMFRFVAALSRNETVMAVAGSAFFLLLILLGGFLLSAAKIPVWYKWVYWGINPISYAQKAMAINEFGAPRWQSVLGPDGRTLGDTILAERGLPTEGWWIWVGVAVQVFAIALYNVLTWLCHAYLQPLDRPAVVLPLSLQEKIADEAAARKATQHGRADSLPQTTEARKAAERNVRRASIAVGVMSTLSKQASLPPPATAPPAQPAGSPRRSSRMKKHSLTEPSASALTANLSGVPMLDAHGSGGIPAGGAPRWEDGPFRSSVVAGPLHVQSEGISFTSRRSIFQATGAAAAGDQAADKSQEQIINSGMVLPFDPLSLSFSHVHYYVPLPRHQVTAAPEKAGPQAAAVGGSAMLQLLCDCSGAFQPGVLTALVGSSGAGKTTLMDVLAGRKTGGKITGSMSVGGFPKDQTTFRRAMGYCEQNDVHAPYATVAEALWFSCRLRFTSDVDDVTASAFVDEVMDLVELEPIKGSLVGVPGLTGLSVEQRKRLTIAVELVANPSIVFMDEPTSGLDARAAAIVMRTVRNTVDTGRTVVCTIHQPSIDIFEAFDALLLMKVGGRIIYHGPLGARSQNLVRYFEAIPGLPALAEDFNPATWVLQITIASMEKALGGIDFADIYHASQTYKDNLALIEELSVPEEGKNPLQFAASFPQSHLAQYRIITHRNFISYWRNSSYNCTRFVFGILLGILFGSALWDIGQKRSTLQDLNNVLGALYLVMVFLGIINATSVQPVAHMERSVSHRECPAGMYSSIPFGLAQCTVELPYVLAQCLLFGTISYWMISFQPSAGKFFWYIFIIYLGLCTQTFYGIMVVYATPNLSIAGVLSSLAFGTWNLFTGFLIGHQRMPRWYAWYYYLNPFAYSLEGIVLSQLGDIDALVALPDGGSVSVKEALAVTFGYHYSFLGYVVLIMIGFSLCFAVTGLICLHKFKFQSR